MNERGTVVADLGDGAGAGNLGAVFERYFWWLRVFCSLTIFWPAALKRSGSMVATTLRLRAGAVCVV
jgi:hypothetical protein